MSMLDFFQRLAGNSDHMQQTQRRFDSNLRFAAEQGLALDRLKLSMIDVRERVTQTQKRIRASTLSSGASGEHYVALSEIPTVPQEIVIMSEDPSQDKTLVPRCPFEGLRDNSQIIRRRDLVELGDTFKSALDPLTELVSTVKTQVSVGSRLQRWMGLLAVFTFLSTIMLGFSLFYMSKTARSLGDTVDRIERLEKETAYIRKTAASAAAAAEEARIGTQTIANVQASSPTLEILPPAGSSSHAPLVLRVTRPVTPARPPASSAYDSVVVPVEVHTAQ